MIRWSVLGGGVHRLGLNSTDSCSAANADLDVALVAPGWTPRVLDKIVFSAALSAVSDSEHAVIEVLTAAGAGEYTGGVVLEDGLVSFDGDRDGPFGEGILKRA